MSHDELEGQLEQLGRELLRHLMQDHLDRRAGKEETAVAADAGRRVVLGPEGQPRTWRERNHSRLLTCVFGPVRVTRIAYRGRGVPNVHPAGEHLSLPVGRHPRGLARLAVLEAVRGSFDQAAAAIERRCGKVLGKRCLKELVLATAVDVAAYYAAKVPTPCTREMPLVIQVDGKGVVMRPEALREATRRAAAKTAAAGRRGRLAPGGETQPQENGDDGLRLRRHSRTTPAARHRAPARRPQRATTAVAGPESGAEMVHRLSDPSAQQVVADAFAQAEAGDPQHLRDWIVLVDGPATNSV